MGDNIQYTACVFALDRISRGVDRHVLCLFPQNKLINDIHLFLLLNIQRQIILNHMCWLLHCSISVIFCPYENRSRETCTVCVQDMYKQQWHMQLQDVTTHCKYADQSSAAGLQAAEWKMQTERARKTRKTWRDRRDGCWVHGANTDMPPVCEKLSFMWISLEYSRAWD